MESLVDLYQLRVFAAVARHLSFTKAAEELFMSQPAVSLQIKNLEDSLGTKLFLRSPQQIALTPAGGALLAQAEEILVSSARLRDMVDKAKRRDPARVVIGVSSSAALLALSALVQATAQHRERTRIDIQQGNTAAIQADLLEHRIDFGLIAGPPESSLLTTDQLCQDEMLLVVAPQHRWAALTAIPPKDLASELLLVREKGSGTRNALEQALRKKKAALGPVVELVDQAAIALGAVANIGPAILPRRAAEAYLSTGALKALNIEGLPLSLAISLAYHQDKLFRPLEREVINSLFKACDRQPSGT